MISVEDKFAIHELLALYGHIIDAQQWDRLEELFVNDIIFDATDFGVTAHHGIEDLRASWAASKSHPLAHHATNIVVSEDNDGTVRVLSKGLGVGARGRVGSVIYHDIFRKESAGWRIAQRVTTLRRPTPNQVSE